MNLLPTVVAAVVGVVGVGVVGAVWYYGSAKNLQVGYQPVQPVRYSHRLHTGQLGMDCRYCHVNVERSAYATIPATQSCVGCHAVIKQQSPLLAAIRASWASDRSVPWVRVHKLPDYVFFDHSVHVAGGVGCRVCHGRIDQMDVVSVFSPLSMIWCLDCHRNPGPSLRPRDRITDMACGLTDEPCAGREDCCSGVCEATCQPMVAAASVIVPAQHCSGCHR